MFARNQSQIAGHLLAALEPRDIAEGHAKASEVIGPTPGCVISNRACACSSAACCAAWIQLADLLVQTLQQPQQVLAPPPAAQPSSGSSRNAFCPASVHSLRFFCTPRFSIRCCNPFFTRVRISTSLCR